MMEKFGSQRSYINIEFESYAELGLVALECCSLPGVFWNLHRRA